MEFKRGLVPSKQALHYAGRARSPAPAVGHFNDHVIEQKQLVADALVNPLDGEVVAEESTTPSTFSSGRRTPWPPKSKFRSFPNPYPTPPSRRGTRRSATPSSATRIWSTSRPTRSCSKSPRPRSEEHTSELQPLLRNSNAVFCLNKKTAKVRTQKH